MPKALVNSDGKLLVSAGKVATDECDAGCCGSDCEDCALPGGSCRHALCFEFNADAQDLVDDYWDNGIVASFRKTVEAIEIDVFDVQPYFQKIGDQFIAGLSVSSSVGGGGTFIEVPMSAEEFFGNWHEVRAKFTSAADGHGTIHCVTCAYGQTNEFDFNLNCFAYHDIDQLLIGSGFAANNPVAISVRGIEMLGNPTASEEDFSFPDDSFSSTIGTGQSIIGDTVRMDGSLSGFNGYLKDLVPVRNLSCRCGVSTVKSITASATASGGISYDNPEGCILDPPGTGIASISASIDETTTSVECPDNLSASSSFPAPCPAGCNPDPNTFSIFVSLDIDGTGGRDLNVQAGIGTVCGTAGGLVTTHLFCADPSGTYNLSFSNSGVDFSVTVIITW